MAGLPYLPSDISETTDEWDWQHTVTGALSSIGQAGMDLMKPIGEQMASAVQQAMPWGDGAAEGPHGWSPAPAPAPAPGGQDLGPPQAMPMPEIKPFSLGSLADWGMQAPERPPRQQQQPEPVTPQSGSFALPDPSSWLGGPTVAPPVAPPAGAGPGAGPPPASGAAAATYNAQGGAPGPGDIEAYIRRAAAARGIDPDVAVRVAQSEGGLADPVRQSDYVNPRTGRREESYGPFQLYLGGGLGNAALERGIDPRNPAHWRQGIDFALDEAARSGWGQWYGAGRVGIGGRQGLEGARPIGVSAPAATAPATAAPPAPAAASGAAAPPLGTYTPETLTPNQLTEGRAQGLSTEEALAVCGPAAAVAFARANGRNPTLEEAKELASSLGLWDVGAGMHGPASQVRLLEQMGVPSRLAEGADWGAIAREVQAGRPVIVDTPQHYFTVTGYDPRTGQFEFGQSAGVLKASKGRTRYRPDEIEGLGMGAPRATIYMGGR